MRDYRSLIRRGYPGYRVFLLTTIDVRPVEADFLLASDQVDEQLLAILGNRADPSQVVLELFRSLKV